MAPPSQLSIKTSAVLRLVKEEASYHKELEQQQSRVEKLKSQSSNDENAEYQIKQELKAIEETKAVFPSLKKRIAEAVDQLDKQLESEKESGESSPVEDINKAKEAIAEARVSIREVA
ncbi:tubulin binding cofactor A [Xylona heveae TC161]|uniref:Tubulin-specific chaperone A n=1 Tax=Xylona heveae (strain CBS 132557 / TC161) TaxID=1328760 RepID=A0A165I8D3_XYLHT|nr:tubulin binding cofactor A [Xylona heveae TC161]KZF24531.1 tubulin binding cofactor A [Xylona heveae TC161]